MAKARMGFLPELFGGMSFKAGKELERAGRPGSEANAIGHVLAGTPIYEGASYGALYGDGEGGWDFDSVVGKALERNLWVQRCVDVIGSAQARLPIIFRQDDPYDGEEYKDPILHKLLNRRPNSYEDSYLFRYRLTAHLLLSKRGAFIEPIWDNMGRLSSLHLIPPDVIEPIPDEKTFISGFRVFKKYRWGMDEIPADKLIWIRLRPHPQNPYMQMTPLMAAGLTLDTDFMARLYNRNYLQNGGKNGLLVAVHGLTSQTDADELRERFRGGPGSAGRPTVIEAGAVSVEDLGATPHDAQWLEAITGSKEEIFMAFGVPISVGGDASGRTFDNADAEDEGFWAKTEVNHCDGIARGMDRLTGSVDDDKYVAYDYSGVAVLQRQERLKHEKALEEYNAGLITWDEYREATGKKPFNIPESRAAFIPITGKGALAINPSDMKKAGSITVIGQPTMEEQQAQQASQQNMQLAMHQSRSAPAPQQAGPPRLGFGGPRPASNFGTGGGRQRPPSLSGAGARSGFKSDDLGAELVVDAELVDGHPYLPDHEVAEAELGGILAAWSGQQERVIPERVMHAKVRKFTRHWDGEGIGTKALNPRYIVEVQRWADDLGSEMRKTIEKIADREARRAARDMDSAAFTKLMAFKGKLADPSGVTPVLRVFGSKDEFAATIRTVADPLERLVKQSAARQSQKVMAAIQDLDSSGASATEIQAKIKEMTGSRSKWQKTLARYLTTASIEGTRHAVYSKAGNMLQKTWNCVGDEHVRPTHFEPPVGADGQVRAIGSNFKVGKGWLQYPGDPSGPVGETINCRCWLEYEVDAKHEELFDDIAHLTFEELLAMGEPDSKDLTGSAGSHPVGRGIGTVLHTNDDEDEEDEL